METKPQTFMERMSQSIFFKLVIMFFLILILLIPMNWIHDLISERNVRSKEVSNEIASKWGRTQIISTPVIAIPYKTYLKRNLLDDKNKNVTITEENQEWIFLLPNRTVITSTVKPETRKRGIYETVVYTSDITLNGDFPEVDLKKQKIDEQNIDWAGSKLLFGISDLKGLTTNPQFDWDSSSLVMSNNTSDVDLFENSLSVDLPLDGFKSSQRNFSMHLNIRGSEAIHFFALANETKIKIDGEWSHPSFSGGYLPETRMIEDGRFAAQYNIPHYNRKRPQQWYGQPTKLYELSMQYDIDNYSVNEQATIDQASASTNDFISVQFLNELDTYQKTMRVAKYGILIILLTFVSLFFTEIIKKQRVHLIQYVLIGAGMVLFYALLLSISEHLGFNWAYAIAATSTVALIGGFVGSVTKNYKIALFFATLLSVFYGFIFQLLQLRDYSLIVGTIGLFLILVLLMRYSTKINWYQFDQNRAK